MLDKTSLTASLKTIFGASVSGLDATAKANIEQMATDMATAIDTFVKTGTVAVSVASVSGVLPGGGTSGPGSGTGTIS
jgi:hypothetical protein